MLWRMNTINRKKSGAYLTRYSVGAKIASYRCKKMVFGDAGRRFCSWWSYRSHEPCRLHSGDFHGAVCCFSPTIRCSYLKVMRRARIVSSGYLRRFPSFFAWIEFLKIQSIEVMRKADDLKVFRWIIAFFSVHILYITIFRKDNDSFFSHLK